MSFNFASIVAFKDAKELGAEVSQAWTVSSLLDSAKAVKKADQLGVFCARLLVMVHPDPAQFKAIQAANRTEGKKGEGLGATLEKAYGMQAEAMPADALALSKSRSAQARFSQIKREYEGLPKSVTSLSVQILGLLEKADPTSQAEAISAILTKYAEHASVQAFIKSIRAPKAADASKAA